VLAAPVLVDLRREGHLDIVVMGLDGRVHAYAPDGKPMPGFPVEVQADGVLAKLASSPAVARDAAGDPVLIFGSNHVGAQSGYLFALSGLGNDYAKGVGGSPFLPGFPAKVPLLRDQVLPTVGTGIPAAPVVADVGDGVPEIVIHGFFGRVWIVGLDGKLVRSLDLAVSAHPDPGTTGDQYMLPAFGQPAVGDVTGTGVLSPVAVGAGNEMLVAIASAGKRIPFSHMVGAWDGKTGRMLDGFPKANDDMALFVSPVVVDLDGDGKGEVIAGSGGYWLHAWKATANGGEAAGFPHFTGGWTFGAASAGPLLGDGRLAVATSTREGYVFAWQTQARASAWQETHGWLTFKGNPQRTGQR
jgi:hypothetical protein